MKVKILQITLALIITAISLFAQKLPKVQTTNLQAPENVKIDGNASEWGNFAAYNNATEIYYSMANDNDNLYLVIQAKDNLVVRKILAGGVTLTINPNPNQKITVSYPVIYYRDPPNISLRFAAELVKKAGKIDSIMNASNKQFELKAKEIRTSGMQEVDTLLSIYNTQGIKTAVHFDEKLAYTYELAIPLKYLGLSLSTNTKFTYNIKLDGSDHAEGAFIENIEGGVRVNNTASVKSPTMMQDMMFFWTPTDFTGSCTLAKK